MGRAASIPVANHAAGARRPSDLQSSYRRYQDLRPRTRRPFRARPCHPFSRRCARQAIRLDLERANESVNPTRGPPQACRWRRPTRRAAPRIAFV